MNLAHPFVAVSVALLLCAPSADSRAATYVVGADGAQNGCTHATVVDALAEAARTPGPDTLHLLRDAASGSSGLTILQHDVALIGGFERCADVAPGDSPTVISGAGAPRASVFTIRGPGVVQLTNIAIVDGDAINSGGGIHYVGSSIAGSVNRLVLTRVRFERNEAPGGGGGVYFRGESAPSAELVLRDDTDFVLNQAGMGGGAIYLIGQAHLEARADGLAFILNRSLQDGGAIHLSKPASALIAAASATRAPRFFRNEAARSGGALMVWATELDSEAALVRLIGHGVGEAVVFEENRATLRGGAIALAASRTTRPMAEIAVTDVSLLRNRAGEGAALWISGGGYTTHPHDEDQPMRLDCNVPTRCSHIEANEAGPEGAVVALEHGTAVLSDLRIEGNQGGDSLVRAATSGKIWMGNVIVARNRLSDVGGLFELQADAAIDAGHLTLARNQCLDEAGRGVVRARATTAEFLLSRSIVWQPGCPVVTGATAQAWFSESMLHAMPPGHDGEPSLLVAHPRFARDGSLAPAPWSTALDFSRDLSRRGGANRDIDGAPRSVDLPQIMDRFGTDDLGAIEVQTVPPDAVFGDGFDD